MPAIVAAGTVTFCRSALGNERERRREWHLRGTVRRAEQAIRAPANRLRRAGHFNQHLIGGSFATGGDDVAEIQRRFAAADVSLTRRHRSVLIGDNADAEITRFDNQAIGCREFIPAGFRQSGVIKTEVKQIFSVYVAYTQRTICLNKLL